MKRLLMAIACCLLVMSGCGDSGGGGDAGGNNGDSAGGDCESVEYRRDNYAECTEASERKAAAQSVRDTVEQRNLEGRDPGEGDLYDCGGLEDLGPIIHACTEPPDDPGAYEGHCLWKVMYWRGERLVSDPGASADPPSREPVAVCSCDYDINDGQEWCRGEVPDSF